MNLTAHIERQPMLDPAYRRHLRTADVFNEKIQAQAELRDALDDLARAIARRKAADERYRAACERADGIAGVEAMLAELEAI